MLGRWMLVQAQDALLVGAMWFVGLLVAPPLHAVFYGYRHRRKARGAGN